MEHTPVQKTSRIYRLACFSHGGRPDTRRLDDAVREPARLRSCTRRGRMRRLLSAAWLKVSAKLSCICLGLTNHALDVDATPAELVVESVLSSCQFVERGLVRGHLHARIHFGVLSS